MPNFRESLLSRDQIRQNHNCRELLIAKAKAQLYKGNLNEINSGCITLD